MRGSHPGPLLPSTAGAWARPGQVLHQTHSGSGQAHPGAPGELEPLPSPMSFAPGCSQGVPPSPLWPPTLILGGILTSSLVPVLLTVSLVLVPRAELRCVVSFFSRSKTDFCRWLMASQCFVSVCC